MNPIVFICIFCVLLQPFVNSKLHKREGLPNTNAQVQEEEFVKLVQKNVGYTEMTEAEFEYEWIIKNASLWFNLDINYASDKYLKSAPFSIETPNQVYKWSLKLHHYRYMSDSFNQITVALNLESDIDDEILTEFDITLNGKHHFKKIFSFSRDKRSYGKILESLLSHDLAARPQLYNDLKISLKGKSIVPTMIIDTHNSHDVLGDKSNITGPIESDPDQKIIQELLHALHTAQASSLINVQPLLLVGDNFGLKELLQEKLLSKINVTNAAEIYQFMFINNKPELKKEAMEFFKRNSEEVTATPSWISILETSNTPLLAEIFSAFVNRTSEFDPSELVNVDSQPTEAYIEN